MSLIALLAIACAPAPPTDTRSDVAGCAVVESRYGVWEGEGEPWQIREQRWDDLGRLVFQSTEVLPGQSGSTFSSHEWVYDGERVALERTHAYDTVHDTIPPMVRAEHAYDGADRVETITYNEQSDGTDTVTGRWVYDHDPAGHLQHAEWDGNRDGVADLFVEEVWVEELLGWRIERSESFDLGGDPLATEVRELDTEERLLRQVEDWDADSEPERVQIWVYDELDRIQRWDLGGVAMIDQSCDWTFVGEHPATMSCTDQIRTGTFLTTWRYPRPGRADLAEVFQQLPDSDPARTEAWSFEWDCPEE